MATATASKGSFSVKAYPGDGKTLLAFNCAGAAAAKNLAGFTIHCEPAGQPAYYLMNQLQFADPSQHAQVAAEPANSSVNAPIHKFRWVHYAGGMHGVAASAPVETKYTVTPRFFSAKASMLPLDPAQSLSVNLAVGPFHSGNLQLGFTRGFVQSQAFVHHFGAGALIRPKNKDLLFDTSGQAGVNGAGTKFTFLDEYLWSGSTARACIFDLLQEVQADPSLRLSVFAYDLNEPDLCAALLTLAASGQIRIILDDAALHHTSTGTLPEDVFESDFAAKAKHGSALLRGHFARFAHDKVLIVADSKGNAQTVLTGSTNFSVTGLYVNSNHVLVFRDPPVAAEYQKVFEAVWSGGVSAAAFQTTPMAQQPYTVQSPRLPPAEINFSPHTAEIANGILKGLTDRVAAEKSSGKTVGNVLFAVMQLDGTTNPVYTALKSIHSKGDILSYGISDSPGGISLYTPNQTTGVLVTGKPGKTQLPAPFDQLPPISGHQIHHKFVICGFNGPDPVVYCGSSNLAPGGEHENGDNLLAIRDAGVVTAFAIEALALVDHFQFLDRFAQAKRAASPTPAKVRTAKPQANKSAAAAQAGWFLSADDLWANSYFDPKDLHFFDRELFA